MKVILLDNVNGLGKSGSEVIVRSGYARNFLIPTSKAIPATKKNVAILKEQQLELQTKVTEVKTKAQVCAETIRNLGSITIRVKSGIKGKLFGSIGSRDIAAAITTVTGIKIYKSQIRLPNHNILRKVGTYDIRIHIYNEIFVKLNVIILSNAFQNK